MPKKIEVPRSGTPTCEEASSSATVLEALQLQNATLLKLVEQLAGQPKSTGIPTTTSTILTKNFARFDADHEKFADYLDRLETHFRIIEASEANKKLLFISLLTPALHKLLKSLVYPDTYNTRSYNQIKTVLSHHLDPELLVIPSSNAFINRKQKAGETVSEYINELRSLAVPCKYKEQFLSRILRDVFVAGLRSKKMLDRLFTEDDTTLEKTFDIAYAMERAELSTKEILEKSDINSTPIEVNKLSSRPMDKKNLWQIRGRTVTPRSIH